MLIKDKDILAEDSKSEILQTKTQAPRIDKKSMREAWGDAFDYYLRGITERYLKFHGRATRLEFWGFFVVYGIVLIPLYLLAIYIYMPLLPYYYVAVTFLPAVAVSVRRLHDINKRASLYLVLGIIAALSAFFIQWWALIPLGLWVIMLIRLWSKETDISDGLYGPADETDEIYGEDNIKIIKKFRFYALTLLIIWVAGAFVQFGDWSLQATQTATNEKIMESVEEAGQKAGLTASEIKDAKQAMIQNLKNWNGKMVQQKDITDAINKSVSDIVKKKQSQTKKASEADSQTASEQP